MTLTSLRVIMTLKVRKSMEVFPWKALGKEAYDRKARSSSSDPIIKISMTLNKPPL